MLKAKLAFFVAAIAIVTAGLAGSAGAQLNTTLRGTLNKYPGTWYSGIWGYDSPGGTALAIFGQQNGIMFINVTNPAAPTEIAYFSGSNTIWRELKTYDKYAYVVCDDCAEGLRIFDLTNPLVPVALPPITTWFGSAHTIWIDQELGYLFALGTNNYQGMQVFDLNVSKTNPPRIFTFDDFYIHDFYSQDGIGYAAAIFDGVLATMDLTGLPASAPVLDTIVTDGAFTHNVWTTANGAYALTTDEVSGGHITIVDVSDPADVSIVGNYTLARDPGSIVHNVFMKDDIAYISWYRAGLEIVDFTVPTSPQQVGYYDTYPGSGSGFDGSWGNYAFASSGLIYIGDINTGLYVVEFNPNYGSIQGTVTDLDSGDPLQGVLVEVPAAGEQATTGADGQFRINLDPGTHTVHYSAFGYEHASREIDVTLGNVSNGDVALESLPRGTVSGFVLNSGGGGLSGATVQLLDTPLSTTSGPGGAYSVQEVPAGAYLLKGSLFGFGADMAVVNVVGGLTTNQNLTLTPSAILATMETNPNWTVGATGDNASSGIWTRVEPLGTYAGGGTQIQPEVDHTTDPGNLCFVTGQGTDPNSIGENDVDSGRTTLVSAIYNLTGLNDPYVRFHRWYVNDGNGVVDDVFKVDVSSNGGTSWVNIETLNQTRRFWEMVDLRLSDYITPSNQVRFRFIAEDIGSGSIVEAGIDDFEIYASDVPADAPEPGALAATALLPATPNPVPSGAGATLRYQLAQSADVSLEILDVQGRRVAQVVRGRADAGAHSVLWSGRDESGRLVPAGIYFQRFRAGGAEQSDKLVLVH